MDLSVDFMDLDRHDKTLSELEFMVHECRWP